MMAFYSLKMLRRKRLFEGPAERPRLEILPCGFYSRVIKLPTFLNLIPALLFGSAVVVSLGYYCPFGATEVTYCSVELARWRSWV